MATITQIQYALSVAQYRNFKRAAAACFVTQPTLSMQLQKLEDELGMVLFDRSRKPVAPTAEGEQVLAQFRRVLAEFNRIDEVVQNVRGVIAGPYRLGIIPTMAPYVLPRILPAFGEAYAEVELHIEELTTDEIIQRLSEDRLDGGILATPLGDRRLLEFPLSREPFAIYHAPNVRLPLDRQGRVRMDKLPLAQLLVMKEGHCLRAQTLDLCSLGLEAEKTQRFIIEAGSMTTLCMMVQQGPYFTVLPAMAAEELCRAGQQDLVKEIAGSVPYREIALVAHRTESRRAIRDALITVAKEHLCNIGALPLGSERVRRERKAPVAPR